ncbi:MAG: S8 family serine peptidase [Bacteroidales bacterium]|jgi:hypothetical protein|nr:S8 family serine peptidase [Bacteroidales bacterium]
MRRLFLVLFAVAGVGAAATAADVVIDATGTSATVITAATAIDAMTTFADPVTLPTSTLSQSTIADTAPEITAQEYVSDAIYIRYRQESNKKSNDYVNKAKRAAERGEINAKVKSMSLFKNEVLKRTVRINVKNSEDLEKIIKQFEKDEDIEMIERIPIYRTYSIYPNDSLYGTIDSVPLNWHLTMIGAERAWALQHGSPSIKVAVVDNAVWGGHEDLQIAPENLYDVTTKTVGSADPPFYDSVECKNSDDCPAYYWSHGTHCAGVVGAITNNGKGVASLAGGVTVMGIASNNGENSSIVSDYESGIIWAAENGANVISLSFGSSGRNSTSEKIIDECIANNIVIVAAAGNESSSRLLYPAAYSGVISVASLDSDTAISSFSSFGTWVTVAAPGGFFIKNGKSSYNSILSTTYSKNITYKESGYNALNGKYYDGMHGTSMACPMVASLCGLLLSYDSTLSPQEIRDIIIATSVPIKSTSSRNIFPESGMINPEGALRITGHTLPAPKAVAADIQAQGIAVTWNSPIPDSSVFYRLYKNGVLYRDTFQAEEFFDTDMRSNNYYIYGVSAVYANGAESFHTTINIFVPNFFYVRANVLPDSNAGTVKGLGTFRTGYSVTLEAHAAAGYKFKEWNFYGTVRSADSVYTFDIDKNQTLNAIFEENIVSVEDIANNAECFDISPNPVNDKLTIKSKKNNFKVSVFNDRGQMIFLRKFHNGENLTLDVAHLAKGMYFLTLDGQTVKFIKQ